LKGTLKKTLPDEKGFASRGNSGTVAGRLLGVRSSGESVKTIIQNKSKGGNIPPVHVISILDIEQRKKANQRIWKEIGHEGKTNVRVAGWERTFLSGLTEKKEWQLKSSKKSANYKGMGK